MRVAAKAILVSPQFIYRVEQTREGDEPQRVNDWELATRLSYFLWSSMPDAELIRLAGAGELSRPATLEKQVRRMLADPKARRLAESFAAQWLRTKELREGANPASDDFPQYTEAVRDGLYAEPVEFFHGLLKGNLPLSDCLDSRYTYANEALARFYGLPAMEGAGMRRVALEDARRGGVLGMAGVLTLTSYPRRTSPVLRGKWVMEEILGTPPPPPPPNVSTQKVEQRKDGLSFRQQLEAHRQDAACAGCHSRMDPLGFGLENYNAIGLWRTQAAGQPVDSAGQLTTGEKFSGPVELKKLLLQRKPEFVRNIAEKMLSYALGRGLEPADWGPVREITQATLGDGTRAQTLVVAIAKSFPFQFRRPAPQVAQTTSP